jgi:hypothetical protein
VYQWRTQGGVTETHVEIRGWHEVAFHVSVGLKAVGDEDTSARLAPVLHLPPSQAAKKLLPFKP